MKNAIKFLACDSMGVRSFSFYIETDEGLIIVDPGAALGPSRYGLPPHPLEVDMLEEKLDIIREKLAEASIVIITHYHFDHYLRGEDIELYKGKVIYLKHPKKHINRSQAIRAYNFLKKDGLDRIAKEIFFADGSSYNIGKNIHLTFSKPVWHGEPGTKLGYIIMVLLNVDGYKIAYTSDVQGPMYDEPYNILRKWSPNTLILGGPPTYLTGYKVKSDSIEKGIKNIGKIAKNIHLENFIVDHHLLRDLDYASYIDTSIIKTCAEYNGVEINQLEAKRRLLWGK